jgi:hypothetical protein
MTQELINLFNSKVYKSNTIHTYELIYGRLIKHLGRPITQCSPKEVIDVLDTNYDNINSRWTALNLIVMLVNTANQDASEYLEYRNALFSLKEEYVSKNLEHKHKTLPSYEEFIDKLNLIEDPLRYVINFLLINYGLRNLDLDIYVTDKKEDLNNLDTLKVSNIALVGRDSTTLFINNYKTLSTYGRKVITIDNPKANKMLRQLTGRYLLTKNNGEHYTTNIAYKIKAHTIFNLIESDVFKIIMKWVKTQPNVRALMKDYSKTRGTNMGTMIQYYTPELRVINCC